jgi:hypothetical protein
MIRIAECLSPVSCKAPMRFRIFVVVAAFALAGCNANREVDLSSQPPSQVVAGPDYNPYNPISYAQNSTGIGGGGGK